MSTPSSSQPSHPSHASTPSSPTAPNASPPQEALPVCAYHHLRQLQQSNPLPALSSNTLPDARAPLPPDQLAPRFDRTELSADEMTTLSAAGIEFSRRQLRLQGFPFPDAHPLIPMIRETVDTRAAVWRAGLQLLFPSLEDSYLDKIETDTKLGLVYDFLALYLSSHESRLGASFPTHEANPAA